MDKFTASNGYTISAGTHGIFIRDRGGFIIHDLGKYSAEAVREFIQAERDAELGRWRWPENPDCIVYPREHRGTSDRRRVVVVNEASGLHSGVCVEGYTDEAAALAWFAAHPEPKPWRDAKYGEVWALTVDGAESAFYPSKSMERTFTPVAPSTGNPGMSFDWPEITEGRRIYPEVSDADR